MDTIVLDQHMQPEYYLEYIKLALSHKGILRLKNFPIADDNAFLTKLSLLLGKPTEIDRRYPFCENKFIHIVKKRTKPIYSKSGSLVLSTTELPFNLHTDEYFNLRPADYVLLLCIRQDPTYGGITTFSHIDDIISDISYKAKELLKKKIYPSRDKMVSILWSENHQIKIRFNASEILNYYTVSKQIIPEDVMFAISSLGLEAVRKQKELLLDTADCLIIDNTKMLHGRTAFHKESDRLFKRVRLHKV